MHCITLHSFLRCEFKWVTASTLRSSVESIWRSMEMWINDGGFRPDASRTASSTCTIDSCSKLDLPALVCRPNQKTISWRGDQCDRQVACVGCNRVINHSRISVSVKLLKWFRRKIKWTFFFASTRFWLTMALALAECHTLTLTLIRTSNT